MSQLVSRTLQWVSLRSTTNTNKYIKCNSGPHAVRHIDYPQDDATREYLSQFATTPFTYISRFALSIYVKPHIIWLKRTIIIASRTTNKTQIARACKMRCDFHRTIHIYNIISYIYKENHNPNTESVYNIIRDQCRGASLLGSFIAVFFFGHHDHDDRAHLARAVMVMRLIRRRCAQLQDARECIKMVCLWVICVWWGWWVCIYKLDSASTD